MARLDGQEFVLDSNYGSIFPQPLQSVHGNYSPGVTLLRFSRTPQGLAMTVYERQERNVLYIDRDGGFHDARVAMREEVHLVSTRPYGGWKTISPGWCCSPALWKLRIPASSI